MCGSPDQSPSPDVLVPREWAERTYNVRCWWPMPVGGHFAVAEQPVPMARNTAAFFAGL
jgi:hypothetical protein